MYIVSASLKGVIKEKEISKYMAGTTSDLIATLSCSLNGSEHSCPTRQYPISQITGFRYRQYSYHDTQQLSLSVLYCYYTRQGKEESEDWYTPSNFYLIVISSLFLYALAVTCSVDVAKVSLSVTSY